MIMIDIETLGLRPGSAIISLAAVRFDQDSIGDQLFGTINLYQPKLRIEPSTVQWWMKQPDDARGRAFPDKPTWTIEEALNALSTFYQDGEEVWSHGSGFDIPMLEAAYHRHGLWVPWCYRDIRDTRTLFALRPDIRPSFDGVRHSALDDAMHQAKWVQEVLREVMP